MTVSTQPAARQRHLGYDLLRIFSICGVVAIHTFGAIAANDELRGSVQWWMSIALSTGFVWAVPVFVMLSGALSLSERAHSVGIGQFYAKRARRILPAIIAWTFIYLVLIRMLLLNQRLSGSQIVLELFDARIYPHLYFLWLIAGLYLVAPVLAAFLAAGGLRRAIVFASATLGFTLLAFMAPGLLGLYGISRPLQLGALTLWLGYIGYFVAGYALSRMSPHPRWIVIASLSAVGFWAITIFQFVHPESVTLLTAVSPSDYLGTIVALLAICVFVVGVNVFERLPIGERLTRLIVTLSEASFGVFLVHLVVLLLPYAMLSGFRDNTSLPQALAAYAFILAGSFLITIGARRVPGIRLIF